MERRLAAILAADVVGYSKLINDDEGATLAALRRLRRELFIPAVRQNRGNIIKSLGDGWLVEFASARDAVDCAIAVQDALKDQALIKLRMGVHIGDVTFEDEDIFGDGVNISSRLQEIAAPGTIVISDATRRSIDGNLAANFTDLGPKQLKNIDEPVNTFGWGGFPDNDGPERSPATSPPNPIEKPSIAVLPFDSLSSDPDQAFFADGIVEDLITALSRFPWLFVIARNSSFSYKGEKLPIKHVAKELGVQYVVEGTVRSSATRLRVTVQLIEAGSDHHLWADNYDRPMGDLFDLQDEITQAITGVLIPALSSAERERSIRDNRPNLNAWMSYQKGLAHFYRPFNLDDHAEARRLFDRAVELDEGFADAHAMIALMGVYALDFGHSSYSAPAAAILDEAQQAAQKAVQYGDNNAFAHIALGRVLGHRSDFDTGVAECEMAVRLNPNLAIAHHELGFILVFVGRYEEAVACFDQAIALSPNDPSRWNFYFMKGIALYGLETYEEAIVCQKEASRLRPSAFWPYASLAACFSALGRFQEGRAAMAEALKRYPDLNASFFAGHIKRLANAPSHLTNWPEHLAKVDLPQ